jgi:hypothetical protein
MRPLYKVPKREGTVSVAANFVLHVGERMKRERRTRVAASCAA